QPFTFQRDMVEVGKPNKNPGEDPP
ncbi:MAG: hypothetical protein RIT46_1285, partial [Pseudomonadota bacterium]